MDTNTCINKYICTILWGVFISFDSSVTPLWCGGLLVHILFCIANIVIVTDARSFAASRGASGHASRRHLGYLAASKLLWDSWLAHSMSHTRMHASQFPCCMPCMQGGIRIEYSVSMYFSWFSVRGSTRINWTPVLFTDTGTVEFTGFRVHITSLQHSGVRFLTLSSVRASLPPCCAASWLLLLAMPSSKPQRILRKIRHSKNSNQWWN